MPDEPTAPMADARGSSPSSVLHPPIDATRAGRGVGLKLVAAARSPGRRARRTACRPSAPSARSRSGCARGGRPTPASARRTHVHFEFKLVGARRARGGGRPREQWPAEPQPATLIVFASPFWTISRSTSRAVHAAASAAPHSDACRLGRLVSSRSDERCGHARAPPPPSAEVSTSPAPAERRRRAHLRRRGVDDGGEDDAARET